MILRHSKIRNYAIAVGVAVLSVLIVSIAVISNTQESLAVGAYGDTGNTTGGSSAGYWTSNGFGWRLYSINSSGPDGGFKSGSWAGVKAACSSVGSDSAWVHVVRNPSGNYKSFSYSSYYSVYGGSPARRDRPSSNGDPYYTWDINGNVINGPKSIGWAGGAEYPEIKTIHGYYNKAGGPDSLWGETIGWFCYDDNPPWTVTVHSDANLTVAEPGQTITWEHYVVNGNQNKADDNIALSYRNSGDLTGADTSVGTVNAPLAKSATSTKFTSSYTIQPSDFGKNLCRSTVATPYTHKGGTSVSSPGCVKIVKKPKVNVLGGDVVSKSDIRTSVSPVPDKTYGSFGQYGLFANGIIDGMASGGAYGRDGANGVQSFNGNCSLTLLTFANSQPNRTCANSSSYGSYGNSATQQNLNASFPVLTSTPTYESFGSLSNLINNSNVNLVKANGNITLSGATLGKGRWLIINASGRNVTINGNINYNPGTMYSLYEIPQLVIIANNINITSGVTNIDAWLSASGTINTCSDGPTNLTVGDCSQVLTVNGPVSTNHLLLRRTAGGGIGHNAIGDPAEIFNLRADAYLWSMARALEGSPISVASTIELPPRF